MKFNKMFLKNLYFKKFLKLKVNYHQINVVVNMVVVNLVVVNLVVFYLVVVNLVVVYLVVVNLLLYSKV